ncbi:MAG: hypothetical protein K8T90_11535 [Planctomycetes bacterium]|nr:hypothetical protein [Planctomycetota bacterium]
MSAHPAAHSRLRRAVVAASACFLTVAAYAHGITPHIQPVEDAANAASQAVLGDPAKAKSAKKVVGLLSKKTNERSLADEIRSVGAALKLTESKLAEQTALLRAFDDAATAYAMDLETARATLQTAAGSPSLPKKLRGKAAAALKKFEKALPKAKAPTALDTRFVHLAAAAAAAKGYTPYDAGATHDWVISSLALAPSSGGVDLDGDGTPDNQLASLQSLIATIAPDVDLSQSLTDSLSANGQFALYEMWYVQSLAGDPFVLAGALNATDADGDTTNNFDGNGSFLADVSTLGGDGHPAVRVATSIVKNGDYRIDFTGQGLLLGGISLPENAIVIVEGNVSAPANDGFIGFSISLSTIQTLISGAGVTLSPLQLVLLNSFLDIDTDGNGSKDALSASFSFTADKATVSR